MQTEKLAIIVPYRNRESHLKMFIPAMSEFLKIPHRIYVIEQLDFRPFNRGKLLNIGSQMSRAECDYMCFHDVDMIPIVSDYSYTTDITHLATEVEQFEWKLPYDTYFGGVTMFPYEAFYDINGYSNNYWGWGAEDDDLWERTMINGHSIFRRQGRYRSLVHERKILQDEYKANLNYLTSQKHPDARKQIMKIDGLSSLQYSIAETIEADYTHVKVLL